MATRRSEQKARTLRKITETARRLFTENRYEEVTARRVAAEAGLSTGAVANHFRTKAELWEGVMKTPPPTDSVLTRQAADIESSLRTLLAFDAEGRHGTTEWGNAIRRARTSLARLDEGQDGIPEPVSPPTPASEGAPLSSSQRMTFILDVMEVADHLGWHPARVADVTPVLVAMTDTLARRAGGGATARDLSAASLKAAAWLLVIYARGVQDDPARV
jgi:AcrR family transcriptional regulator